MIFIRKYYLVPLVIFIAALLIRIPNISYPKQTQFDEILYEIYSLRYIQKKPYFADHPPLAVMIMAALADNDKTRVNDFVVNKLENFNEFPYEKVRGVMAVLGAFIPVSVFFIVRKLYKPFWCAVAASIPVIFDNALIVYSRYILPDVILLSLGFGGTAMIMESETVKNKFLSVALFITGCILLGGAFSVKWTGLCFAAFMLMWKLFHRKYRSIIMLGLIILTTHMAVWYIFFRNFGNNTQPVYFILERYYRTIVYPNGNDPKAIINYLPTQFKDMFLDYKIILKQPASSQPEVWFFGGGKIRSSKNEYVNIFLQSNYPAWFIVIAAVVTGIILISIPPRKYKIYVSRFIKERKLTLLMFGYLISYLPMFLVGRQMYLYHYLTPLVFGYMLVPVLLAMINSRYTKWVYLGLIFTGFIFVSPVTYGISVPYWWLNILGKM